jgi:hypothetical protein
MTQPDFVRRLEAALARRGLAFDQAELLAWVASMWSHVGRDPDAERWAGEFLGARAAQAKERATTSEQEHSPRAGVEEKKHDHSLRLWIVVAAVIVFFVLWKTELHSLIVRMLGL